MRIPFVLTFLFLFGCIPDFPASHGIPWPLFLGSAGRGYGDDGRLLIFATAATYQGNFGAGSGNWYGYADALCQSDADRPTYGTYQALLAGTGRTACTSGNCATSGAAENVNWVLQPERDYYRATDGVRIFTTNSSGIHPYSTTTADAAILSQGKMYWTGLDNTWPTLANTCLDWSDNTGGNFGVTGEGGDGTTAIEFLPHQSCDNFYALLCVRQ